MTAAKSYKHPNTHAHGKSRHVARTGEGKHIIKRCASSINRRVNSEALVVDFALSERSSPIKMRRTVQHYVQADRVIGRLITVSIMIPSDGGTSRLNCHRRVMSIAGCL